MSPRVSNPPHTVLLADDHAAYRHGLARAIAADNQLELVAEVGDGADALRTIEQLRPDIALVDVTMPGLSGIEVAQGVAGSDDPGLHTRVLIMAAIVGVGLVEAASAAGSAGVVTKDSPRTEICEAIVAACN